MAIDVIPSGKPLGAEIRGVNIPSGVDDRTFREIWDALNEHSVVVLRGQHLSPGEQRDFCCRFGEPEVHALKYTAPGFRDVLCISNIVGEDGTPIGLTDAGRVWHTDGHFEERPTLYSMLNAMEVPRDENGAVLGQTWFASTAAAYESLPEAMKNRLDGLVADNTMRNVYRLFAEMGLAKKRPPLNETQQRLLGHHPVVRVHPDTGRKCLYVTVAHTERIHGLSDEDARALVKELQEICVREENVYKHQWQKGDLLMWDNCATLHLAIGDYRDDQRRLMFRVSVRGLPTS